MIDKFKRNLVQNKVKYAFNLKKLRISELKKLKSKINQKLHERGTLF